MPEPSTELIKRELDELRRLSTKKPFDQRLLLDKGTDEVRSFSGADISVFLIFNVLNVQKQIINKKIPEDWLTKTEERILSLPPFIAVKEIDTISVSSARSVYPVRSLGEVEPSEYTRGARTIAGAMIFVTGGYDFFARASDLIRDIREQPKYTSFFIDEIPEFDIMILASNEYGDVSTAFIKNVTITNWGTTFSKSDMYLEGTYSYVAREYYPLLPESEMQKLFSSTYRKNSLKSAMEGLGGPLTEKRLLELSTLNLPGGPIGGN